MSNIDQGMNGHGNEIINRKDCIFKYKYKWHASGGCNTAMQKV